MTGNEKRASESTSSKNKRARYVNKACNSCRKRKVRCSGDQGISCESCIARNLDCIFDGISRSTMKSDSEDGLTSPPPPNNSVEVPVKKNFARRTSTIIPSTKKSIKFNRDAKSVTQEASSPPSLYSQNGYQGETALEPRIERLKSDLAPTFRQMGVPMEQVTSMNIPRSTSATSLRQQLSLRSLSESPFKTPSYSYIYIECGGKKWQFPHPRDYEHYLHGFFDEINPCHPCINEPEFRRRTSEIIYNGSIASEDDASFLALNYIIFANVDITFLITPPGESHIPGWNWFSLSEELSAGRTTSFAGDLSLIQLLIFQSLYLTHTDQHNAAYNVSGLACRVCFQLGLHLKIDDNSIKDQYSDSRSYSLEYIRHMRQRVFWTVYCTDRRVSQVCGRPHAIRDIDISIEMPEKLYDLDVIPDKPLPSPDPDGSFMPYLSCTVLFARWSGEIWDRLFAAGNASKLTARQKLDIIEEIDAKISYWSNETLPTVALVPSCIPPNVRQKRQQTLVVTRMLTLRILLKRSVKEGDNHALGKSADYASSMLDRLKVHQHETKNASSLRHHLATSLGVIIISLAMYLIKHVNNSDQGNNPQFLKFSTAFKYSVNMLHELSTTHRVAWRIAMQLEPIVNAILFKIDNDQARVPANSKGSSSSHAEESFLSKVKNERQSSLAAGISFNGNESIDLTLCGSDIGEDEEISNLNDLLGLTDGYWGHLAALPL